MTVRRVRLAAVLSAAAVTASILLAATPAQAMTFDGQPTRTSTHFTVAGARHTLQDFSCGTATRTVHVGGTSGEVPAHDRVTITDAHGARIIRAKSVSSDLEATIAATFDHLDALPAGATPDFTAVHPVTSFEYPGTATVSGNDTTSWTVTVRDTRDGYGMVFDSATGGGVTFRF